VDPKIRFTREVRWESGATAITVFEKYFSKDKFHKSGYSTYHMRLFKTLLGNERWTCY